MFKWQRKLWKSDFILKVSGTQPHFFVQCVNVDCFKFKKRQSTFWLLSSESRKWKHIWNWNGFDGLCVRVVHPNWFSWNQNKKQVMMKTFYKISLYDFNLVWPKRSLWPKQPVHMCSDYTRYIHSRAMYACASSFVWVWMSVCVSIKWMCSISWIPLAAYTQ